MLTLKTKKMKTLCLTFALFTLTIGCLIAKPLVFPEPENKLPQSIKNQIINSITKNDFFYAQNLTGHVFIQVRVAPDNTLELVAINADNEALGRNVAMALRNSQISIKHSLPVTDYCLKLSFNRV
jgi:hypothetical protein